MYINETLAVNFNIILILYTAFCPVEAQNFSSAAADRGETMRVG